MQDDLQAQIKSAGDKLIVIDFFATWCGPCKMISPKLTELSQKYAEKVLVLKVSCRQIWINDEFLTKHNLVQVDVDECEDIAMEYNVSSMPTFVFFKNGNKIEEFAGANAEKLEKTIVKNI